MSTTSTVKALRSLRYSKIQINCGGNQVFCLCCSRSVEVSSQSDHWDCGDFFNLCLISFSLQRLIPAVSWSVFLCASCNVLCYSYVQFPPWGVPSWLTSLLFTSGPAHSKRKTQSFGPSHNFTCCYFNIYYISLLLLCVMVQKWNDMYSICFLAQWGGQHVIKSCSLTENPCLSTSSFI